MSLIRSVLVVLAAFQVLVRQTTAISKDDITSCIAGIKQTLDQKKAATTNSMEKLKNDKLQSANSHREEEINRLATFIQKEKNLIAAYKQSAIQENYNVTTCNDSTEVYVLISQSFATSAQAILVEYRDEAERNYSQNVNAAEQYALAYKYIQEKLETCQSTGGCLDDLMEQCTNMDTEKIPQLGLLYPGKVEKLYRNYMGKLDALYQDKTKELVNYTHKLRECFRTTKNVEDPGTHGDKGDGAVKMNRLDYLLGFSFLLVIWKFL